jgi:hypothetical protein
VCGGASGELNLVFNKITHEWSGNGVRFDAGHDDTDEAIDPFTYKLRGLYLNGSTHMLTLEPSQNIYLNN